MLSGLAPPIHRLPGTQGTMSGREFTPRSGLRPHPGHSLCVMFPGHRDLERRGLDWSASVVVRNPPAEVGGKDDRETLARSQVKCFRGRNIPISVTSWLVQGQCGRAAVAIPNNGVVNVVLRDGQKHELPPSMLIE